MEYELYNQQKLKWPSSGRHILANFDETSIIVYQAYKSSIAEHAIKHQKFGGEFSYARMSWIKPNFLWMMYRSGWATKPGQERILRIRIPRNLFDEILSAAVPSTYDASRFKTHSDWQDAVEKSDVRLQWDPDHDPRGKPLERRAIQLGLRNRALRRFGYEEVISIEDITVAVTEQRENTVGEFGTLMIPIERVYIPANKSAVASAMIDIAA